MSTPLALDQFFALLPVSEASFYLPATRKISRTAGGDILSSIHGSQLWRGKVTLDSDFHREMSSLQVLLEDIERSALPFLIHPLPIDAPEMDPDGTLLSGHTVRLVEIGGADLRIRLGGLPVGYRLQRGDFLSFTYGTNPVRHALHRVLDAEAVAGGDGRTLLFRVVPSLQPGAVAGAGTGAVVTLHRPSCKAVIIPDTITWPVSRSVLSSGFSFDFIQTRR